jgi:hypothetical protein
LDFPLGLGADLSGTWRTMQWKSNQVVVTIDVDSHNRVVCYEVSRVRRETLPETVRRWLRR